jgi:hypothetical protein
MTTKPERAVVRDEKSILERLEPYLQIDENALDEALIRQPDYYYQISKALALQISRRDAAKQLVEEAEANADIEIRRRGAKEDKKFTEGDIKSQKVLNIDVQNAERELLELNRSVGLLTALKESFQQRGYALNKLVDLYVSGYFGDATPKQTKSSQYEYKEERGREARVAMNKARRERG